MLFGKDSRKPWGKWDILLASAWEILQGERCPDCGNPVYICRNESELVQFRTEEVSCAAVAKVEAASNPKRGKKRELPPGTRIVAVPYHVTPGVALSTLRDPYYEELAKKHDEVEKTLRPNVS